MWFVADSIRPTTDVLVRSPDVTTHSLLSHATINLKRPLVSSPVATLWASNSQLSSHPFCSDRAVRRWSLFVDIWT